MTTSLFAILTGLLGLALFIAGILALWLLHPIWSVPCFLLSGGSGVFSWIFFTLWSIEAGPIRPPMTPEQEEKLNRNEWP